MPMNFPDSSLAQAAEVHRFRPQNEGETIAEYRQALHEHVLSIDRIEAFEIKFGVGWDQWDDAQKRESIGL